MKAWRVPTTNFVDATSTDIIKLVSEFDNRLTEVEGLQKHVVDPKTTIPERKALGILIWRIWFGDHEYHPTNPEFAGVRWVEIVTRLKLAGVTTDAAKAERAIHDIEQSEADDPAYPELLTSRVKLLKDYSKHVLHPVVGDDSPEATITTPVSLEFARAKDLLVSKDSSGVERMQALANAGNADAAFELGRFYMGLSPRDETKATEWFEKAARAGSIPAVFRLAANLTKQGQCNSARAWYELSEIGARFSSSFWNGEPRPSAHFSWLTGKPEVVHLDVKPVIRPL